MPRRVFITGSSQGIGLAIAKEFAKNGDIPILHGIHIEPQQRQIFLEELHQETNQAQVPISIFDVDLQDSQAIKEMCHKILEDGAVDILVNNAGIQSVHPIQEFPENIWESILSINLSAAFYTSKYLLPEMHKQNFGRIINISSVHGLVASSNKSAYVAAKHGLLGLTKVIALENARMNITANAICPGWVDTDLIRPQYEKIAKEQGIPLEQAKARLSLEKQPNGRMASMGEVAASCVFLASEAARGITGTSLPVDGGWSAQ